MKGVCGRHHVLPERASVGETGTTLVELVVVLAIFAVLMAMLGPIIFAFQDGASTSQSIDVAVNQMRPVFQVFTFQVTSAGSLGVKTESGGDPLLWMLTGAYGHETCVQWRVLSNTSQLQERSWVAGQSPSSSWLTEATGVTYSSSAPPFKRGNSNPNMVTMSFDVNGGHPGQRTQIGTSVLAPTLSSVSASTSASVSTSTSQAVAASNCAYIG